MGLPLPSLQLSFVYDFVPSWAGPTAIFFGVELILLGVAKRTFVDVFPFWHRLNGREQFAVVGGFGLGVLFSASAVLRHFDALWLYAVLLFCLGQVINGAGAVRIYRKVLDLAREHQWPGSWQSKVKKVLLRLFVLIITGWLLFLVLSGTNLYGGFGKSLRFVWTFIVFSMAALGIAFKLDSSDTVLNRRLRAGFILCVAGAAIYNINPFLLDLAALVAGTVAYSLGFWLAALLLIQSERIRSRHESTTTRPSNAR